MTVLLSSYFSNSLQAQINIDFPVEELPTPILSDTLKVLIEVDILRQANVKLTERLYLIELTKEYELQIADYKEYTIKQETVIIDFQSRLAVSNEVARRLNNDLNKAIKRQKIYKYSTIGAVGVTILVLILK